jgi:hypothetical protein
VGVVSHAVNWKGGIVRQNGYRAIFVGFSHHLADSKGYAYEHRVVAEKKIGRRLLAGEVVHHRDENKLNNAPDNLVIEPSIAHHKVEHRRANSKRLRLPDEPNEAMACACGCGGFLTKYDGLGRERRFISGHNGSRKNPNARARITRVTISCACGCGAALPDRDAWGRPRRFISGHNAVKR